jgi:hypothetical protein
MEAGLFKKINLKISSNFLYKRLLFLFLILSLMLLISYGYLMYQVRIINLKKIEMYSIYQEREIYVSRFYSRFNENKLIQELYSVTNDSKYLEKRNKNFGEMQNEFDSLFYYCRESDDYCIRLDSSRYFLDMYFNKFVPKNDSIHDLLDSYKSENIEVPRIKPGKGVLRIDTVRLNTSAKDEIKNYLAENLNILEKRIMDPTQWIVRSDRSETKLNQKIIDARIKSYHVWQKIVLILTLGMILLLLIDLALILVSPIEKPQPVYNTLPNLQYSAINDDFEDELTQLLQSNKDLFLKYIQINLVFPRGSFFPIEIISSFQKFSYDNNLKFDVHDKLKIENLTEKMAYILLEDETMAHLLEASEKMNLIIGEQVGILAYGDSPLKRVVANGITVIDPSYQDSEQAGFLYKKMTAKSNIRFIKRNSL